MIMIEKVARALCNAEGVDPDRKGNETEFRWQEYKRDARAAIEAMHEPTDLMGNGLPAGYRAGSHSARQIWQAMIKAALTEQQQ